MALGVPPRQTDDRKSSQPPWFKSWGWTGASFIGAVGIGLLLLTELRAGAVLAALGGLGAYYLLAFLLPQTLSGHAVEPQSGTRVKAALEDPRVELLVEAHQHAATIAGASAHVPLPISQSLDTLYQHAQAIIDGVSLHPEKLTPVLRFFTYYLPSTADLVTDRVTLAPHAGSARLAEIDQTLIRLVEAFAGFEAAVRAPDLASVDLDVELLEQALNADLQDLKR